MDDEANQLEAELKRLQPAPVSQRLLKRIETQLAPTEVSLRRGYMPWVWAAALSAAAAIALVFTPHSRDIANPTSSGASAEKTMPVSFASEASLKPVAAENVLVSADDEGLVTLADGTQARRERLHFVDTITWRNPRTNASLKWTVPREEVRVVPVAFQ